VLNPKLRGKPCWWGARGGFGKLRSKAAGRETAMTFREAMRLCPKAIVVPGQYEHYADYAERVRRILETYTPAVETARWTIFIWTLQDGAAVSGLSRDGAAAADGRVSADGIERVRGRSADKSRGGDCVAAGAAARI